MKAEFRRHKDADASHIPVFMAEWSRYAVGLGQQLGVRGPHKARPLGAPLDSIDHFSEDQLSQLFALYQETQGKSAPER